MEEYPFSNQEHILIYKLLQRSQKLFCASSSEDDLFNHLITCTLFDHRMEACLSLTVLSEGKLGWRTFPTFTKRQAFNAARLRLMRRGFIYVVEGKEHLARIHGFNLPGIFDVWLKIISGVELRGRETGTQEFEEVRGCVVKARDKAVSWMKKHYRSIVVAFPVQGRRGILGIEEFVQEAMQKSRDAQEQKFQKILTKPPARQTARDILFVLAKACELAEVPYFEPHRESKEEEAKFWGQVAHFVQEQAAAGHTPGGTLSRAAKDWRKFRFGLKGEGGKPIPFRDVFSFAEFYPLRRHIYAWWAERELSGSEQDGSDIARRI